MFKLKDKYNTPDFSVADLNLLSEEDKKMILEKYRNVIDKYFDIL